VTEEDWLTTDSYIPMLAYLREQELVRCPASERRLRLFAAACCRRVLTDSDYWRLEPVVSWAECYADGSVPLSEAARFTGEVDWALGTECEALNHLGAALDLIASTPFPLMVANQIAGTLAECRHTKDGPEAGAEEVHAQSNLLRDIFGNPFRPVSFDPCWRSADAVGVARGIYEDRAFDRLPLLADALMDAGCDDEQVIGHCRGDGPHVRGCWVVDMVLAKE
jgi:hypothetical protein